MDKEKGGEGVKKKTEKVERHLSCRERLEGSLGVMLTSGPEYSRPLPVGGIM